jgi:hypothetical protein
MILVFGTFVNAAGMTEPSHDVDAPLARETGTQLDGSDVTALYAGGLLVTPGLSLVACGWAVSGTFQQNRVPQSLRKCRSLLLRGFINMNCFTSLMATCALCLSDWARESQNQFPESCAALLRSQI